MWQPLITQIRQKHIKSLARSISLVENEAEGFEELLRSLPAESHSKIIGITGPPGAGKSTLTDALIGQLVSRGHSVAILCVDPSSPFNLGALLGDRIRMSEWYTHPQVFIRSLATRGSLGGLHPRIIEITDLLRAFAFDYIIVETVGVGQSEVEIAGLADTTVVVVVPEAGDEVQTMKAGLMEIADIFVVNKADRPEADRFVRNLRLMLAPAFSQQKAEVAIVKTIASQKQGVEELMEKILIHQQGGHQNERKTWLLTAKAWRLIQDRRMKGLDKNQMLLDIKAQMERGEFNLYRFVDEVVEGG